MLSMQGAGPAAGLWWAVEPHLPGLWRDLLAQLPCLRRGSPGRKPDGAAALICAGTDLPDLAATGAGADLFPVTVTDRVGVSLRSQMLAADDPRPLLLTVGPAGRASLRGFPLIQGFRDRTGRRLGVLVGHWDRPDESGAAARTIRVRVPASRYGASAVPAILGAVRLVMSEAMRRRILRPLLVRVDVAGLGLDRATLRQCETHLDTLLAGYEAVSGRVTLALMERGLVPDHAAATVTLPPGRSCRMGVTLPPGRSVPVLLRLRQHAGAGSLPMLAIGLRSPDGTDAEAHGGAAARPVLLDSLFGACAAILPSGPDGRTGPQDHLISFAPTAALHAFGRCRAMDGIWEVTLTNTGPGPARMSLMLDDALPLWPEARQPAARLGACHSTAMDFDMLDAARPDYCEMRNRLEALVQRADALPPRVLRRALEPASWPAAMVYSGSRMYRMRGVADFRATGRAVSPASGRTACVTLAGDVATDRLLRECLEALADGTPAQARRRLALAMARGG